MRTTILVMLLSLCLIALVAAEYDDLVVRPNLGIVFRKEHEVSLSPTVWHHTVAIPFFPHLQFTPLEPFCDATNNTEFQQTCSDVQDLHDIYSDLRSKIASDVHIAHMSIQDVMAVKSFNSRNRRGWFNLLGNIAKKVMGVATEDDIKVLQKHISHLMVLIKKDKYERVQDVDKLHSYEVKADLRMDKLQKHLIKLDRSLTEMTDGISTLQTYAHFAESLAQQVHQNGKYINATFSIVHWLHNYNINLQTLSQIKVAAVSQLADVTQLLKGRLTVNLIEPRYLRTILSSVNQALKLQSTNLFIKSDITPYYTHNHMVISSHDESFLYVKIRIPIASASTEFSLFKVDAVPVPTSRNNTIYTLMQGFHPWLAISSNAMSYLELSDAEALQIKSALNKRNVLPTQSSNQSCVLNLFFGMTQAILSTCRHTLIKNPLLPLEFVYNIPHKGYLFYTPTRKWSISCFNKTTLPRPALNQSVIAHTGLFTANIPCGCKMTSHTTELLPDATHCPAKTPMTRFSANFLVYFKIYKQTLNDRLTIDDMMPEPLHFELPPLIHQRLNFTDVELQDGMTESDRTDLDNFRASLTTDNYEWSFFDWQDHPQADTIVAASGVTLFIIQGLSIIAMIYMYRRMTAMKILLSTLAVSHYGEALDYRLPTTTVIPMQDSSTGDIPVWRTCIIIASFVISLINITLIIVEKVIPLLRAIEPRLQLHRLHTELYCVLYSNESEMSLKIATIPHSIYSLTCMKSSEISNVTFFRRFFCTFASVNWSGLELYSGALRIILPTRVKVPWWHYGTLSRLQSARTAVKFVLVQGDLTFMISDWSLASTFPPTALPTPLRMSPNAPPSAVTPLLPTDPDMPATTSTRSSNSPADSGNSDRPPSVETAASQSSGAPTILRLNRPSPRSSSAIDYE